MDFFPEKNQGRVQEAIEAAKGESGQETPRAPPVCRAAGRPSCRGPLHPVETSRRPHREIVPRPHVREERSQHTDPSCLGPKPALFGSGISGITIALNLINN